MHAHVFALISLLSLSACGMVQTTYEYTRSTPAAGRTSPTKFAVQFTVDAAGKSVVWFEDVSDAEGDLGRNSKTWSNCTILNRDNWHCPAITDANIGVLEQVLMRNGKLTKIYWGDQMEFTRTHRIRRP